MNDEYPDYLKQNTAENGTVLPLEHLEPETLDALIESFVLREGTDYGDKEVALKTKVSQIREQLQRGDLKIVFDATSETASIVPAR